MAGIDVYMNCVITRIIFIACPAEHPGRVHSMNLIIEEMFAKQNGPEN